MSRPRRARSTRPSSTACPTGTKHQKPNPPRLLHAQQVPNTRTYNNDSFFYVEPALKHQTPTLLIYISMPNQEGYVSFEQTLVTSTLNIKPSTANREDYVFFEETSLIANPPLKFEDLKRRMKARLDSWGVSSRV